MTDTTEHTSDKADAPTPPAPATRTSEMDHIDQVMRKTLGENTKPGDGIAVLLRHVAAQMGVHADSFKRDETDKAPPTKVA